MKEDQFSITLSMLNFLTCGLLSGCKTKDECDKVLEKSRNFKGFKPELKQYDKCNKVDYKRSSLTFNLDNDDDLKLEKKISMKKFGSSLKLDKKLYKKQISAKSSSSEPLMKS